MVNKIRLELKIPPGPFPHTFPGNGNGNGDFLTRAQNPKERKEKKRKEREEKKRKRNQWPHTLCAKFSQSASCHFCSRIRGQGFRANNLFAHSTMGFSGAKGEECTYPS